MKVPLSKISTKKGFAMRGDDERLDQTHVRDIALSMKASGQKEAVIIRAGDNELIHGEYRLAAAKRLGWSKIDVEYRNANDHEAHLLALILNRNKSLTPEQIAAKVELILKRVKYGHKGREEAKIARQIGIEPVTLREYLTTYRSLKPEVRTLLRRSKLPITRDEVRIIQKLEPRDQLIVSKKIEKVTNLHRRHDLVEGFAEIAKGEDSRESSPKPKTPEEEEPSEFIYGAILPLLKEKIEQVPVVSIQKGEIWFKNLKGKEQGLHATIETEMALVNEGDLISVHISYCPRIPRPIKVLAK